MLKKDTKINLQQENEPAALQKYLTYSPLYNIKWMLTLSRMFCGFPLKPTSPLWNNFEFVPCVEFIKLFILLSLSVSPSIAVLSAVAIRHFTIGVQLSVSAGASLDFWAGGSSLNVIPLLSLIAYFMSFKKCAKGLGKLCQMMADINLKQGTHYGCTEVYKKAKTISQRMVILFHLIGLLLAACMTTFWYFQLVEDGRNGIGLVPGRLIPFFLLIQPFSAILGMTSPIISSADFIVIYLIQHLSSNLIDLKKVLKKEIKRNQKVIQKDDIFDKVKNQNEHAENSKPNSIKPKEIDSELITSNQPVFHVDIALDIGLDICNAVCKFNYTFQSMVFISYAVSLILATSGLYVFVSNIFWLKGFANGFWTLAAFLLVVLYIGRLYYLTSAGWILNHSRKKLGLVLDKYITHTDESNYLVKNIDGKGLIKNKIEMLQKKLSVETPITPFDAFNLSTGAFLAAFANILTYLIILIQFKMSQNGSEAG